MVEPHLRSFEDWVALGKESLQLICNSLNITPKGKPSDMAQAIFQFHNQSKSHVVKNRREVPSCSYADVDDDVDDGNKKTNEEEGDDELSSEHEGVGEASSSSSNEENVEFSRASPQPMVNDKGKRRRTSRVGVGLGVSSSRGSSRRTAQQQQQQQFQHNKKRKRIEDSKRVKRVRRSTNNLNTIEDLKSYFDERLNRIENNNKLASVPSSNVSHIHQHALRSTHFPVTLAPGSLFNDQSFNDGGFNQSSEVCVDGASPCCDPSGHASSALLPGNSLLPVTKRVLDKVKAGEFVNLDLLLPPSSNIVNSLPGDDTHHSFAMSLGSSDGKPTVTMVSKNDSHGKVNDFTSWCLGWSNYLS